MFFWMSKFLWSLLMPSNLFLAFLAAGVLLLYTKQQRLGRRIVAGTLVAGVIVAIVPIGALLTRPLEARFPAPASMPAHVDGIVVLGGSQLPRLTSAFGQPALNDSAERMTEFIYLARLYPDAKLVFSGGSGQALHQEFKEAETARMLFARQGLNPDRVLYDSLSRNTFENAQRSWEIASPQPGEVWLLITSARHMPRAVGCFRRIGWDVTPYPVDYHVLPTRDLADLLDVRGLGGGLEDLREGLLEWAGLVVYWLTDKTPALLPGP